MPLFKKNYLSNKQEKQFIGANVPMNDIEFITLKAISEGISKSELLRRIISYSIQTSKVSKKQLIENIKEKIKKQFEIRKHNNPEYSTKEYSEYLDIELGKLDVTYDLRMELIKSIYEKD